MRFNRKKVNMETQTFTFTWAIATLPDGKNFFGVANLGGFTLRGNVCASPLEATRNLFQLIGGAYNNSDADLALSLALSGTTLQDVAGVTANTPQVSDGKKSRA